MPSRSRKSSKRTAASSRHIDGQGDERHRLTWLAGVLAILIGVVFAWPTNAEVVHGFANIREGRFDFSEQEVVPWMHPAGDIVIVFVTDPPLGYMIGVGENSSRILAIADTTLDELMEAPADLGSYGSEVPVVIDRTYVVAAGDGVFAKFAVRTFTSSDWTIEYYVQTDGSRNLVEPVAVEVTTWGRVKSLYSSAR